MTGLLIHDHAEGRVPGAGFFRMPAALYHADPCPEPSLSASVAVKLVDETPLHAWHAHPRLNPAFEADEGSPAADKGSIAHELILGRGGGFVVLYFDDWRTKAAKVARDEVVALGKTPILAKAYEEAAAIARAVVGTVGEIDDCADFADPVAQSELVMIWQDLGGIWCRAMIDRLTPRGMVYDVKTSGRGLDDRTLQNRFADGFATQPGLYLRGLDTLWPEMTGRFRWRWLFAEQAAPFAVRVDEADSIALKEGAERAELAVLKWGRCMATGRWPGYPRRVGRLGPTDWSYNRWTERLDAERSRPPQPIAPPSDPGTLIFGETFVRLPASKVA